MYFILFSFLSLLPIACLKTCKTSIFCPLVKKSEEEKLTVFIKYLDSFSSSFRKYFLKEINFLGAKEFKISSSTTRQWQARSETKICHFNMDFSLFSFLLFKKYFVPLGFVALLYSAPFARKLHPPFQWNEICRIFLHFFRKYIYTDIKKDDGKEERRKKIWQKYYWTRFSTR